MQPKDSINIEIFQKWLVEIFIPELANRRQAYTVGARRTVVHSQQDCALLFASPQLQLAAAT
jgi:hypothetical protein